NVWAAPTLVLIVFSFSPAARNSSANASTSSYSSSIVHASLLGEAANFVPVGALPGVLVSPCSIQKATIALSMSLVALVLHPDPTSREGCVSLPMRWNTSHEDANASDCLYWKSVICQLKNTPVY